MSRDVRFSQNMVYATNKASDQPEHTRILIRAFDSRLNILQADMNIIWSF